MSTITCIEWLQDNITIVVSFKVLNITALNYNLLHNFIQFGTSQKIENYQLQLYSAAAKSIYVIKK